MLHKKSLAFSLIEMMVAVVIVGALGATAVSSYSKYVIKARVASLVEAAGPAQLAVQAYFQQNINNRNSSGMLQGFPEITGQEPYVQAVDANVARIAIDQQGKITVTGAVAANQAVIALAPRVDEAGNLSWTCKTYPEFLDRKSVV